VEVGCYIQIADPLIAAVFTGWLARATPKIGPDGSVLLDMEILFRAHVEEPAPRLVEVEINGSIQTLHLAESRVAADLLLADGETTELAAGALPDGRPLVLEVRAAVE